jgi:hypothetical protein
MWRTPKLQIERLCAVGEKIRGSADELPFDDQSINAAMAVLTVQSLDRLGLKHSSPNF